VSALVRLVFKTANIRIDFDRDYGCQHKTGWSVALNGSYVVQLEPRLWRALWKAYRYAHTSNNSSATNNDLSRAEPAAGDWREQSPRASSADCPAYLKSAPLVRHSIMCEIAGCQNKATHLHTWEDRRRRPIDMLRQRYVCAVHNEHYGPWEPTA